MKRWQRRAGWASVVLFYLLTLSANRTDATGQRVAPSFATPMLVLAVGMTVLMVVLESRRRGL